MTKSVASKAASAMARARWRKMDPVARREATRAANEARWPRCAECGERAEHDVHTLMSPMGYHHAFKK